MERSQRAGKAPQHEELKSLLSSLGRLYRKVSRKLWDRRLGSYRKESYPDIDVDIQQPLDHQIHSLSDRPKTAAIGEGAVKSETAAGSSVMRGAEDYREVILEDALNDLSERFRTEGPADAGMGQRLRQSTWNHIHQALRLARDGDEKAAQLHAGFANNALKESAHYLDEAAYRALVSEVSAYLEEHSV